MEKEVEGVEETWVLLTLTEGVTDADEDDEVVPVSATVCVLVLLTDAVLVDETVDDSELVTVDDCVRRDSVSVTEGEGVSDDVLVVEADDMPGMVLVGESEAVGDVVSLADGDSVGESCASESDGAITTRINTPSLRYANGDKRERGGCRRWLPSSSRTAKGVAKGRVGFPVTRHLRLGMPWNL